jgi:hypothetical protein
MPKALFRPENNGQRTTTKHVHFVVADSLIKFLTACKIVHRQLQQQTHEQFYATTTANTHLNHPSFLLAPSTPAGVESIAANTKFTQP